MTNQDKADLREMVRTLGSVADNRIADMIGCAVGTVKRYRRAIPGAKP